MEHMLGRTTRSKHFFTRKIVRAKTFIDENNSRLKNSVCPAHLVIDFAPFLAHKAELISKTSLFFRSFTGQLIKISNIQLARSNLTKT